ncbi:hypothetical protein FisN_2Lh167 [Fistulifera solaris]|uniref:Uncharacterized protein n=1 Tax=Fistulifera solaris TaxID=1519565 RepID=A0A1Z5KFB4_FISSO|nr:hypothetical protein FisN_2Lh167 [Fistulifera solaris]|eukprot:GAX24896.1 hypothetical protein FisN_2Lh167 [Fistulifera solaris]
MSRRHFSLPQNEGASQLSFVCFESEEDEKRPPIIPSSCKKGSAKKRRRKPGKSIAPGVAIQTISMIDKKEELKATQKTAFRDDRDHAKSSFHRSSTSKQKPVNGKPKAAPSKRSLSPSKNKQTGNQSAIKKSVEESSRPAESIQPTQEMEVPYAINLGIVGDENLLMACALSDRPKEPLNPGDVIHYFHPAFAAGSELSIRVTQVISTDPSKRDFPLELDNGELIPRETRMRRLKEYDNGKLYNHPGIFRDLENFRMKKRTLSAAERKMLPNERQKIIDILNDIVAKANEKLETLPSDIMNMASTTPSSQKKRKAFSEPAQEIKSGESDSTSDSDSSSDNLSSQRSPRKASDMASRFSFETQRNRELLSPRRDWHKENLPIQQSREKSKPPTSLVLKNLGGLKSKFKTGQTENVALKTISFGARKESATCEKTFRVDRDSLESARTSQQTPVIDLATIETKASDLTSAKGQRSLPNQLNKSRTEDVAMKRNAYSSPSSDSDDDSGLILSSPVFSAGKSRGNQDSVEKKGKSEGLVDTSESDSDLNSTSVAIQRGTTKVTKSRWSGSSQDKLIRPVFSGRQTKKYGDTDSDATSVSTKPTAAANPFTKKTSRWSLESVEKKGQSDGLWESSESDNDSNRISVISKRRITKATQSQSKGPGQDISVATSRFKKLKHSSFLPAEIETQDSSCGPSDDAVEADVWNCGHKYLKKSTPKHESQDEDIEGFSSQETLGNKSKKWGVRASKRAKHTVSASALKLQRVSYHDRF